MSGNNEKESLVDYAEYDLDEEHKDASKITTVEVKYEKAFDVMEAKLTTVAIEKDAMEIEKDVLKKEKDIAVTVAAKALAESAETGAPAAVSPGSVKKPNYNTTYPDRHTVGVLAATPTLIALKTLANNQEAIWWVVKHIETLGAGDNPDWHKSYKDWAKEFKNIALVEYMGLEAAGAGAD